MHTGRGFDRLVNFTDAVVAIALTLLVLPLVEIPDEFVEGLTIGQIWRDHDAQFLTFLLSFLVIWTLWKAHHRTMEYFRAYDRVVLSLHLVWLLTIVVLPFTTELVSSPEVALRGSAPVYLVDLAVSTLALLGLELRGRAATDLLHLDDDEVRRWVAGGVGWTTQGIILLALVVSFVQPGAGLWCLLLLAVDGPVDQRLRRRTRRAT